MQITCCGFFISFNPWCVECRFKHLWISWSRGIGMWLQPPNHSMYISRKLLHVEKQISPCRLCCRSSGIGSMGPKRSRHGFTSLGGKTKPWTRLAHSSLYWIWYHLHHHHHRCNGFLDLCAFRQTWLRMQWTCVTSWTLWLVPKWHMKIWDEFKHSTWSQHATVARMYPWTVVLGQRSGSHVVCSEKTDTRLDPIFSPFVVQTIAPYPVPSNHLTHSRSCLKSSRFGGDGWHPQVAAALCISPSCLYWSPFMTAKCQMVPKEVMIFL